MLQIKTSRDQSESSVIFRPKGLVRSECLRSIFPKVRGEWQCAVQVVNNGSFVGCIDEYRVIIPNYEFIFILSCSLTPKWNATSRIAYKSNVTMLQFCTVFRCYILTKFPYVFLAVAAGVNAIGRLRKERHQGLGIPGDTRFHGHSLFTNSAQLEIGIRYIYRCHLFFLFLRHTFST